MSNVNLNNLTYNFTQKAQRNLWILFGAGLLLLVLGLVLHHSPESVGAHGSHDHTASLGQRIWANLLVNSYFFGGITLGAIFFMLCSMPHRHLGAQFLCVYSVQSVLFFQLR